MLPYAIGLDIGIASVGWAAVGLDSEENPCGILQMGSRIFDAAEGERGKSLAAPRREARSVRRRLRRHRHRNERIRALLLREGVLTQEQMDTLFDGKLEDIYTLRVRALDQLVTPEEFSRILIHLAQRRGFRSNRKSGAAEGEDGKLLKAVSENEARMKQCGYRTVGEMILRDKAFADHKRNKGGAYLATVARAAVEKEAMAIFASQREKGACFAAQQLENEYIEILLSQRSFDEGPGGESPYGGNQTEKKVGTCTLEGSSEPRAARACISFEEFTLLDKLNNLRIVSSGSSAALDEEQRAKVLELCFKRDAVDFKAIRSCLKLEPELRFNLVNYYGKDKTQEEAEKKTKFSYLKAYHRIRKEFEKRQPGRYETLSREQLNEIGRVLSLYETTKGIQTALKDSGLTEADLETVDAIGSFSKFGRLSVKACEKLLPYLRQGMRYNEACEAAGYDFKAHSGQERTMLLPAPVEEYDNLTSPVVRRAVSQTIKVVNAIIREQGGSPTYVNIELARELSRDFNEREKIRRDNESNRSANEKLMEQLRKDYGRINPTGLDLVKLRLWQEQQGCCAYSGKNIPAEHLFDENYAEIDHIIPYSISFDDTRSNKVLVLAGENRDKGNRLPMQYLSGEKRERYIVWVERFIRDPRKKAKLLKEQFTEEDEKRFKERNLQDTKTMAVFLKNYIEDHLLFAPSSRRIKRVTAVSGAVTGFLRKRWGIAKVRANGDLHHAVDALVIACTTDGMIRRVTQYANSRETRYQSAQSARNREEFPQPWPHFHRELEARLEPDPQAVIAQLRLPFYMNGNVPEVRPLFVSRMPRRKVHGPAHEATVKSARMLEDGYTLKKVELTALRLDKDGEIKDYYNPESDRLLYDALRARLDECGGNGEKAFKDMEFRKPKRDGTPGPVVKKVKRMEKSTLNVSLPNGGVAIHDKRVRIDVFLVPGDGYYFVPIYVADTLKAELPDRASVAHKEYKDWKQMREEDFIFSLYPNDLVKVTHKSGMTFARANKESTLPESYQTKSEFVYYKSANISKGSLTVINHDNTYGIDSLGIKTLRGLEKYTVDMLGNVSPVGREKRQPFCFKRRG